MEEMKCSDCLTPLEEKETKEGRTVFVCPECNITFEPAPAGDECPECGETLLWRGSYHKIGRAKRREKEGKPEKGKPIAIRYFCRECGERFVAIYEPRKFLKRASLKKTLKNNTESNQ